ncbi:MAG: trypsin-like peptidase domain-containing protein [Zoogloeaceae bacterium]|nr:trypsin-like peptidase domain-containing protein [Zoogloeaceae bacterium]
MSSFEEASRPVLYENDHPDFAYWGKGSSFLVANASHSYWVTAAHVLSNSKADVDSLRIFPSDGSRISLPFNEQYTVSKGVTDDEDYKDVFVLRIDLRDFDRSGDASLVAQDLEAGVMSADALTPSDILWIVGYPAESNFVDYEASKISNTRSVLRGIYQGRSSSVHCHQLRMETSISLASYDGLSGSPVYHLKREIRSQEELMFPMLVGMLIRGSASSRIAHFVGSDVLVNIIKLAETMPNNS